MQVGNHRNGPAPRYPGVNEIPRDAALGHLEMQHIGTLARKRQIETGHGDHMDNETEDARSRSFCGRPPLIEQLDSAEGAQQDTRVCGDPAERGRRRRADEDGRRVGSYHGHEARLTGVAHVLRV